jgi:hypothetical protein
MKNITRDIITGEAYIEKNELPEGIDASDKRLLTFAR